MMLRRFTAAACPRFAVQLIGIVAGLALVLLCGPVLTAHAATIQVTNTSDSAVVGSGSLRAAIAEAKSTAGPDTIDFSPLGAGPHVINLLTPLLLDANGGITIDGYTAVGASPNSLATGNNANLQIVLDGSLAGLINAFAITSSGNTVRGLVIQRFGLAGFAVTGAGATGNTITGNFIGTDRTGAAAAPNTNGIFVEDAPNVTIGGTTPGARNVVSGNSDTGILIQFPGATGALIQGNYVGTNASGTAALPNDNGIAVNSAPNARIGGTTPGARNVISGNNVGLRFLSTVTNGGRVEGNFVGTDATGSAALGNTLFGIDFNNAPGVTIGGTAPGARNVVSGNTASGILIRGPGSTGSLVQGNLVGTDVSGTAALGNGTGVEVFAAPGVTIGGTAPGAGNVISGNGGNGIFIHDTAATGAVIQGNLVGTDDGGAATLGNSVGISVADAPGATIGGPTAGARNVVAGNSDTGILITGAGATGALIRGNAIFANGGLGIDLDPAGVTPNDVGDGDSGANNRQNFPVLTSATLDGAGTRVSGTLNSAASTAFTVDFYANPSCDASGNGEGQTYLGTTTVNTNGSGNGSFVVTGLPATSVGNAITATATDPANNTSEFSGCRLVAPNLISVAQTGGGTATVEGGATDTFDVALTVAPTSDVTVTISSSVPGLVSFTPSAPLTFTTANWNVPQTVTVASVEDQTVRGSSHIISFAASSADALYSGLAGPTINATHTDNDTASIVVAPTTGLVTTESGGTAQFTVRLTSVPTSAVTIGLTSSNTAEGTVSPSTLTFLADPTALNDQTVTVTGVDDAVLDGPVAYTIVTAAASSGDTFYAGQNPADVGVTNQDNEVATNTPTPTMTLTPTATFTGTPTITPSATPTATATFTPTVTTTPSPTSTWTTVPVRPSEDDDDKPVKQTGEQRLNEQRTNAGNRDDVHTEGTVVGVERSADGTSLLVTIALGAGGRETLVVQIPCGAAPAAPCPDVQVGDYLSADGYQNGVGDPNNYFVATDDLSITRGGRRIR